MNEYRESPRRERGYRQAREHLARRRRQADRGYGDDAGNDPQLRRRLRDEQSERFDWRRWTEDDD